MHFGHAQLRLFASYAATKLNAQLVLILSVSADLI